jgi:hypothetical protein
MPRDFELTTDPEPPSTAAVDDTLAAARVDRIMAMAHLQNDAHVALHVVLIGHRTLPSLLALLQHGCRAVRCLRPDAPSPDREAADLAWIVDVRGEHELDTALRAARARVGVAGRVVVEGAECACRPGCTVQDHARAAGLDVVSFDHTENRIVLSVVSAAPGNSLAA